MTGSPTHLPSFAALAANLPDLTSSEAVAPFTATAITPATSAASSFSTLTPHDNGVKYPLFTVHSPMSTASTASGSDSPSTVTRDSKGTLTTSRCSTPDRLHSPLSLDTNTASSSAASSRAPSPACSHLTVVSSPTAHSFSAPGPSSHSSVSPAISSMLHPSTPPSPAHSSASTLSSSASSDHSSDVQGSSISTPSASSTSSNYRPDRYRDNRSKRVPLTAQQKLTLEEFFRTNHYPTREEKTELGARIGLTSDKVHKWYDNRRTKMNKDGRAKRAEHNRVVHLYNNFIDARAQYTTTAIPFEPTQLARPVMPVPDVGLSILQLAPPLQSEVVHPFLHSMMSVSAQQDEVLWNRAASAQQQLLQAQLHFHNSLNQHALNVQPHFPQLYQPQLLHQQQLQPQQQLVAVSNFFQSAPVAPTVMPSIASMPAPPLSKSNSSSAFRSVAPLKRSPTVDERRAASRATTPSTGSNSDSSLSPSSPPTPVSAAETSPASALAKPFSSLAPLPPSPAAEAMSLASAPTSPVKLSPKLKSPIRPAAQLASGSPGALQQALAGMAAVAMQGSRH